MVVEYPVPFFGNTADKTHCYQASLKMIIKHFQPRRDLSWEELEKITAKVEGLWTWTSAGELWLADNGYDIRLVTTFDYARFSDEGESYLVERYGKEVAQKQVEKSDLAQERPLALEHSRKIQTDKRIPDLSDIKRHLRDGYLVLCNVNSRALNGKPGFAGHFVVVIGHAGDYLIVHDPGLPPQERRIVPNDLFTTAWAFSGEHVKGFTAIKYPLPTH